MVLINTRYVAPEQKLGPAGMTKNFPDSKCADDCRRIFDKCRKAAVIPIRILQRFACNRRHILNQENFFSFLRGLVSVPARRIWCLSEPSKLCANVVSLIWITAP